MVHMHSYEEQIKLRSEHTDPGVDHLMSVPTRVVCHLAAHVVACHLHLEERAVCTHAELVAHPVAAPRRVPAGGTGHARWADHHASIEDDAIFLGGREYGSATSTKWTQKKVIKLDKTCEVSKGREAAGG